MDTKNSCTQSAATQPAAELPVPANRQADGAIRPPLAARRRWRRWAMVGGGLAALLALPLLLYAYFCWASERAFGAAVAEIEKVDPRWRVEQILADRPPIADADNPSLVVGRVDALMRRGGLAFDLGEKNYRLFENDLISPPHKLNVPQLIALRSALE
jgi:hypothetical protein